jgi:hypothetical protein
VTRKLSVSLCVFFGSTLASLDDGAVLYF